MAQTPATYGVGVRSIRRQRWAETAPTRAASGTEGPPPEAGIDEGIGRTSAWAKITIRLALNLIEAVDPSALIADKAFDADAFIFNKLKHFRAIVTFTANAISLSVCAMTAGASAA